MNEPRILGIGGVFLRADDPAALGAWYRDVLGVPVFGDGHYTPWRQDAGDTVMTMSASACSRASTIPKATRSSCGKRPAE